MDNDFSNIGIIGCGRWGSFLAWHFSQIVEQVTVWGRTESVKLKQLTFSKTNGSVHFNNNVFFTSNLKRVVTICDVCFIAVASNNFNNFLNEYGDTLSNGFNYVLCMKGIDTRGIPFSKLLHDRCPLAKIAILVGPGQPELLYQGMKTIMLVDSFDDCYKYSIANNFSSDLVKIQVGIDPIGNEFSAAFKNLIGIGCGILDGCDLGTLKGVFLTVILSEMAGIVNFLGGHQESIYGIACLGEVETTMFSNISRNHEYGTSLVKHVASDYDFDVPGIVVSSGLSKILWYYSGKMCCTSSLCDFINGVGDVETFIASIEEIG